MNKTSRNQLRSTIVQCRTLLERAVSDVLQGEFGIHGTGLIEDASRLTHLTPEDKQYRVQILTHLEHIQSCGSKTKDAVTQLVRETSFTHLNRLCAYKMMEKRGLIREAVTRGLKSKGFLFYLVDHPDDENLWSGGEQELAYRHFLEWLGETLSAEIGILFSPQDLANRLFPPFRVLDRVLSLINTPDLEETWVEDEAIGWVYQYFTPKELRDQARKESQAPRNSYELAFRNQFYTPRYVVEFLVDNTLGLMWYEMRQGNTLLADRCRSRVRRPREIFLPPGAEVPVGNVPAAEGLSERDLLRHPVYSQHRAKKDPREIKVLDPACGSGHFLLYCFDLLQTIYEEAYEDNEIGGQLRQDYKTIGELRKAVPSLILAHNLHGIDIDLRATQIAGLTLWLRCQRAFKELEIKAEERPPITKTNITCAEPMPGEKELLEEFIGSLQPHLLGQLVHVVFEKMKLAGEAGSLLRIEEEISETIAEAKGQWLSEPKRDQLALFQKEKLSESEQPAPFDVSDITDEQFWHGAESRLVESLRKYSQSVSGNGQGLLRQLFSDDAARGFAFVDICQKRFDIILMNPPFGEPVPNNKAWLKKNYSNQPLDLYCWFVSRAFDLLSSDGLIGCISSSSFKTYLDYQKFRDSFITSGRLSSFVDLGWGVLDQAYVEACCYTLDTKSEERMVPFIDVTKARDKEETLLSTIQENKEDNIWWRTPQGFAVMNGSPMIYWWEPERMTYFASLPTLGELCKAIGIGAGGHAFFNRLRWEVAPTLIGLTKRWATFVNGGSYSPFRRDDYLLVDWEKSGERVKNYILEKYPYLQGNTEWKIQLEHLYGTPGITYGKKTTNFSAQTLPADSVFSFEGIGVFPEAEEDNGWLIAYLNSSFTNWFLNATCGLHKNPPYLRRLPVPLLSRGDKRKLSEIFYSGWLTQIYKASEDETSPLFIAPGLGNGSTESEPPGTTSLPITEALKGVDSIVFPALKLAEDDVKTVEVFDDEEQEKEIETSAEPAPQIAASGSALMYSVGCAFGRWDVRYATGERPTPELPDPFAPLPVCAPGALTGVDGLPLHKAPSDYPLRIDWDGILVDDPDHRDDLVGRVRDVFELLWRERAESIERETCQILDVKTLRDYFRKNTAGGFWADHVKRYSKSRRRAPIYWLLQSPKRSYALWVYYHRLDKDILFKALLNYVEPKLRLEESALSQLRAEHTEAGTGGKLAKQLEKQLERQESLLSELYDFRDKLQRAANLALEPDLNDGVVLNIAPLWELVPWAEAKKYWNDLLEGKNEWSSIGKQLRERGLVQT
jgi:hypothetical protein